MKIWAVLGAATFGSAIIVMVELTGCAATTAEPAPSTRNRPRRPSRAPGLTPSQCFRQPLGSKVLQRLKSHPFKPASSDDAERIAYESKATEEELQKEKDTTQSLALRLSRWMVKRAPVAGTWHSRYWHDGVHLELVPLGRSCFAVVFHARGDLGSWTLIRRALFRQGVLLFDRLVKEYAPWDPYRRMYLLNIDGAPGFYSAGSVLSHVFDKEKAPIAKKLTYLKYVALHRKGWRPRPPARR